MPADRQLEEEEQRQEPLDVKHSAGGIPPSSADTGSYCPGRHTRTLSSRRTDDGSATTVRILRQIQRLRLLAGHATWDRANISGAVILREHDALPLRKKQRPLKLDLKQLEDRVECSTSPSATTLIANIQSPLLPDAAAGCRLDFATGIAIDQAAYFVGDNRSCTVSAETTSRPSIRREVIFVDQGVPEWQQLVTNLRSSNGGDCQFDVVFIKSGADGVRQIRNALAHYSQLDAIHIISHGADGSIKLGNTWLTSGNLNTYRQELREWGNALKPTGDILTYGCDVAEDASGRKFVDTLGELTGADVAASTNVTGATSLGGDWNLEYAVGPIETRVPFRGACQQRWVHTLGVAVDTASSGTVNNQTSLTIAHTTSGTNRLMLVGVSTLPNGTTVGSVTYDGINLTRVGFEEPSAGHTRVEIWALVAPSTGTHDVVVNLTGTTYQGAVVGVMTFTGVNQTNPLLNFATASGNSTTASVTLTSQANDLVFGVVHSHIGSTVVPGAGQTEYWNQFIGQSNGSGTIEAGATSVTNS
jgi:hypothetical protein